MMSAEIDYFLCNGCERNCRIITKKDRGEPNCCPFGILLSSGTMMHDFETVLKVAERLEHDWDLLYEALGEAEMCEERRMLEDRRLTLRELIAVAKVRRLYAGRREYIDFRLKLGETVLQACDRYMEEYHARYAGKEDDR